MSILEKEIEQPVCAYARKKGWRAMKFEPDSSRGWPDRIFLGPKNVHFFIEFKAPGKKIRPLQEERIRDLQSLGHRVFVIDNVQAGKDVIDFHTS